MNLNKKNHYNKVLIFVKHYSVQRTGCLFIQGGRAGSGEISFFLSVYTNQNNVERHRLSSLATSRHEVTSRPQLLRYGQVAMACHPR
jgi:hypothetical protein